MPTKTGLHLVSGSRNGYGDVARAGMACVLAVDEGGALLEAKANYPNTVTIYRWTGRYLEAPHGIDEWTEAEAVVHAQFEYQYFRSNWRLNQADYYTVLNEPFTDSTTNIPAYIAYEREMMRLASMDGFRLCILNLAGGSPSMATWREYCVPHTQEAFANGHIYGRHAYGGDLYPLDGNTGRPFQEATELLNLGLSGGIVITELGYDGGYTFDADLVMSQLPLYDNEMKLHPNIIGGCLWTYGDWASHPQANQQDLSPWLSSYISSDPAGEWQPPIIEPPIEPPPTNVIYEMFFDSKSADDPNGGWYDIGSKQIPLNYDYWEELGENPWGDGEPWNNFVTPECRFVWDIHLPPEEHEKYLNEKGHAYKIFKQHVPFYCKLFLMLPVLAGRYRLELDFAGDWYEWIDETKVLPNDPHHAHALLHTTEGIAEFTTLNLLDDNLIVSEFDLPEGLLDFGFSIRSIWGASNNGCFIRSFRIIKVDDTIEPEPLPPSQENIIVLQEQIIAITNQESVRQLAQQTIDMVNQLECEEPELPPIEPPAEEFYIIDVSHHNRLNKDDWLEFKERGVAGVYIKLCDGTRKDEAFAEHYFNALDIDAKVGAYCFLRSDQDAIAQADFFIEQLAQWTLHMPPNVDIEPNGVTGDPAPSLDQIGAFNSRLETVRNRRITYTSASVYNPITTTETFGNELHVAHYGVEFPTLPLAWNTWKIWQYTSRGFDGNGHLDVNLFNGTIQEFYQWCDEIEPPSEKIDLLPYFVGLNLTTYEVKHQDGSQERIQMQLGTNDDWYYVKGENQGFYEQWTLRGDYIVLVMDTSPANDSNDTPRFYVVNQNDGHGAAWCPRYMSIGESFYDGGHFVQFYAKYNCRALSENSGNSSNNNTLIAHYPTVIFTAGEEPIVLNDVIKIGNPDGEVHWFARGIGRVRWESEWGSSKISELHEIGDRPEITREVINCLGSI